MSTISSIGGSSLSIFAPLSRIPSNRPLANAEVGERQLSSARALLDRVDELEASLTSLRSATGSETLEVDDADSPLTIESASTLGLNLTDVVSEPLTTNFSSITAGSLAINGEEIELDPSTDSLSTVLGRLNASPAGIRAAYDEDADTVTISAREEFEPIDLDDGTTGFFTEIGIRDGPYNVPPLGTGSSSGTTITDLRLAEPESASSALADLVQKVSTLFSTEVGDNIRGIADRVQQRLRDATANTLGLSTLERRDEINESRFGISFSFPAQTEGVGLVANTRGGTQSISPARGADSQVVSFDSRAFDNAVQNESPDVVSFLMDDPDSTNFLSQLEQAITLARQDIATQAGRLGQTGLLVNTIA